MVSPTEVGITSVDRAGVLGVGDGSLQWMAFF